MAKLIERTRSMLSNGKTPDVPISVVKAYKDEDGNWENTTLGDMDNIKPSQPDKGLFYNVLISLEAEESTEQVDLWEKICSYVEDKGWFMLPTDEFNGCQRYMVLEPKASTGNSDIPF